MPAEMPKEIDFVTQDVQRPAILWNGDLKKYSVIEELPNKEPKIERYRSKIKELLSSNTKELVSLKNKDIIKYNFRKNTKQSLYKDILSFKSLKYSWDGYGSIPLEVESAANALLVINSLETEVVEALDSISPNPHGTVSLLWENNNDVISLEIGNHEMSYYVEEEGKETLFFNKLGINDASISTLNSYIYWIISNKKTPIISWGK